MAPPNLIGGQFPGIVPELISELLQFVFDLRENKKNNTVICPLQMLPRHNEVEKHKRQTKKERKR